MGVPPRRLQGQSNQIFLIATRIKLNYTTFCANLQIWGLVAKIVFSSSSVQVGRLNPFSAHLSVTKMQPWSLWYFTGTL
jgi:hypothetical protein